VTDTGVGTTSPNSVSPGPSSWTIKSFLDHHLNPDGSIPYLVILSHCHFDHILGLNSLLKAPNVKVLASSHDPSFTSPYERLEEHSLCKSLDLPCLKYESTGVNDREVVVYKHPNGNEMELPILTIHTPGHTPDSLTWYDVHERILYVGDSFYTQTSPDTEAAPWGPERSAAIIFPKEGNLADWWESVNTLLSFVSKKNEEKNESENGERVKLAAGHVTAGVDAHTCLQSVKDFIGRVLRNEVHFISLPDRRGEAFGHWSDGPAGEFSVAAPVRVMEEGRKAISEAEWRGT
jgi:glyoxylase-like metal-dependent hydrolase (beta-lactamase superfamily II)